MNVEQAALEALDPDAVVVVEGGVDDTTALLAERWDHIFFTGSTAVGRIVAEAAAKHLTPTVLELGGKSPTYVHRSADLDVAARRIAWGKFLNAGQTCIAPDYVLVDHQVKDAFVDRISHQIDQFYGADAKASSRPVAVRDEVMSCVIAVTVMTLGRAGVMCQRAFHG